jgi:CheY-like chemotaxis protein
MTAKRVLVVDDDPDIRETIGIILEDEGFDVDLAANGSEALAKLRVDPHAQVILLDLMMPVMNGWEFRAEQEKDPALLAIPVIVISADNNLSEKARAFGGNYLSKPLDIDELLEEIGRVA